MLHPRIAFGLGNGWSKSNRLARHEEYVFKGEDEPLYKFAAEFEKDNKVDSFIFGHFHCEVSMKTPKGADFIILKDWMDGISCYLYSSGISTIGGSCQKSDM